MCHDDKFFFLLAVVGYSLWNTEMASNGTSVTAGSGPT